MTRKEAIDELIKTKDYPISEPASDEALDVAINSLEQEPIDKLRMLHDIYMEGVNMTGKYQGCWVRFRNIEKIIDKYIAESEGTK